MNNRLLNILIQFFIKKRGIVLFDKFINKFVFKKKNKIDFTWLKNNSISWEDYTKSLDTKLFNETKKVIESLIKENKRILQKLEVKLGGSANQFLLYFLIRKLKPRIIFETGVAAGHSSRAILKAIKKNKRGKLYSSDFPYFRIKNPEKYIGIVVEEELKENWHLLIEGDSHNIKQFLRIEEKIDFFHYDSDKSYNGKQATFNIIMPKMSKRGLVIFDDIQDDNFFKDIVYQNNFDFKIFNFENKYVGLIFFNS